MRFELLSAGDQLLSVRLGDQGIVRAMMQGRELEEICRALLVIAPVRGVPPEAVEQLAKVASDYKSDFENATAIANGSWTYLGGVEQHHYGLFLGEATRGGDLEPQWRHIIVEDLRALVLRLESASEALKPFVWAARTVSLMERE